MKKWIMKKRRRKNSASFEPNRIFVKSAIDEYLKKGGKITKIVVDENSFKDFLSLNEHPNAADEFLTNA